MQECALSFCLGCISMNTFEEFAAEIDSRVSYINAQADMGARREDVTGEQFNELLESSSQASGIGLDCTARVIRHLRATDVWDRTQLSAFNACLRSKLTTRLHQPGNRAMQSNLCLQSYFSQRDWDTLTSGHDGTPFGATSAFTPWMPQFQAGSHAGDAGTPQMNLQVLSHRPTRSVATTELDDLSHAPTDTDDSGMDDLPGLIGSSSEGESDMAASKKAVAEEEHKEKKFAAAAKKKKKRPAVTPSVSDPAATRRRLLQHHFSSDRQLPNDQQLHSSASTSMLGDENITSRSCTREDETLAVRRLSLIHI